MISISDFISYEYLIFYQQSDSLNFSTFGLYINLYEGYNYKLLFKNNDIIAQ